MFTAYPCCKRIPVRTALSSSDQRFGPGLCSRTVKQGRNPGCSTEVHGCGARRMAESAALLVDEVLPEQPMRQWVLSFPFQLRFLFASRPEIMGWVLGIVYRVIATHLVKKAGHTHQVAKTGAVTLIQRFGSALNLNVHFHMLFLDGVYVEQSHGSARFRWVKAPTRGHRRTSSPFIKALQCSQTSISPEKAGLRPPPGCYLPDS